jgi:phospholipid/cholesterol/gamma-HCH transport system substrate-binding protein
MIKTAPSRLRIAGLLLFVITCVLVLTYLWINFGGSIPFAPRGYRVQVAFPQANELATGADVRVSGVNVGTVVALQLDPSDSRTLATLEISRQFAPIPRDTHATLRIKTLLGETYVQLSEGSQSGGMLRDGGRLPDAQVAPNVTLDQILTTFDPTTRAAFQTWMQSQAAAITGRGQDINASFGYLPGFFTSSEQLLAALNQQSAQVRGLVANTGEFFNAISARRGELSGLITAANSLFQTTAQRNQKLAELFKVLPNFELQSRLALPALTAFGNQADPVVRALDPIASELTQTFDDTAQLSPQFRALFERLGPVVTASARGLPALDLILGDIPPLLQAFDPFLRNADPMVRYIGLFKPEITGFFGNTTGAAQGYDLTAPYASGQAIHYVRASQTLNPSGLAFYPHPLGADRNNAYRTPGAYGQLASGLSVLNPDQCLNGNPAPPATATEPEPTPAGSASFAQLIAQYVFRAAGRNVPAPACRAQGLIPGFSTSFPQLRADPPPGR